MDTKFKLSSFILLSWLPLTLAADNAEQPLLDDLSVLEQLMNTEVVSSSKFKQQVKDVPASVYIISAQDIESSGALTLTELLYQVPGLHVAQANMSNFAISARGSNGVFANKLLVMVDGRSLYSPLFAGVYWNHIDLNVLDIDRIEIIRGPGSSVWGANAVNGVINIITKETISHDKERLVFSASGNAKLASLHVGNQLNDNLRQATTVNYRDYGSLDYVGAVDESWHNKSLLSKWAYNHGNEHINLILDYSKHHLADPLLKPYVDPRHVNPINNDNRYATLNWEHLFSANLRMNSHLDLGSYRRSSTNYDIKDRVHNLELDGQYQTQQHSLIIGASYRQHQIELDGKTTYTTLNDGRKHDIGISSFYVSDKWSLTAATDMHIGLKYEKFHHQHQNGASYKDDVFLPTLRLNHQLDSDSSVWFSWTRSSRMPSIAEHQVQLDLFEVAAMTAENPAPWPLIVRVQPNHHFTEETNTTIELGWRSNLLGDDWFDAVVFQSDNEDLRGSEVLLPYCEQTQQPVPNCGFPDIMIQATRFQNAGSTKLTGVELSYKTAFSTNHNITFNATYFHQSSRLKQPNYAFESAEKIIPKFKFDFIYQWRISDKISFQSHLRTLSLSNNRSPQSLDTVNSVDDYSALNANINYKYSPKLQLQFGFKDLLHDGDYEWFNELPSGQVGRVNHRLFVTAKYHW